MARGLLLVLACAVSVSAGVIRGKTQVRPSRSDDRPPLGSVVENLVQEVNSLKATNAAQQKQLAELMSRHCESGIIGLNPESHSSRTETKHITFSNAFGSTPAVTAGIIHIDSASRSSSAVRIDVQVQHVGTTGFDLTAHEWLDSHNYGVTLSWMACSN